MKRGKNNPVCIINGFSNIFLNGETEQNLAYEQRPAWFPIYEHSESLGKLKQIALQYQIPVILLIPSASLGSQKALGGTFLHHSSQIIVRLDYSGGEIILELIKHPSKNTIHTCLQDSVKSNKKKIDHSLIEFINKDNLIASTK